MFTIQEIVDMAIRIEKNGEAVYRDAIERISNPGLQSLLEWMADEEVGHTKWLMELKGMSEEAERNPFVEEMTRELLSDQMGDQSFSLKEVDFSKIEGVEDLIAVFIEFENDGILFYEMLQSFIQDKEVLAQLDQVVAEEKRHIQRMEEFLTDK